MPAGSATPLDSITMWSGRSGRAANLSTALIRSLQDGTANATVGQADNALTGITDQLGVYIDGTKIIDHYCNAAAMACLQQVGDHRGLARPEKPGHDRDR